MMRSCFAALIVLQVILCFQHSVICQATAFSYQGSLTNGGVPANGNFAMEFKLFDALSGGAQVGNTVTNGSVAVTNGLFAVALDFGAAPFSGANRFLEITVAGNVLSPRTQLLSAPYAIRAKTVSGPVTATSATAALSVANDQPGISDPSPTNLPPAGLRSDASSTVESNAGLIGVANGNSGFGVMGVANGAGAGSGHKTYGLFGIMTSPTGSGAGIGASSMSPDSPAIEANAEGGGFIFSGKSSDTTSSNPKFSVTATGQVRANASVFAKGFQSNSGFFGVTENGNLSSATVDTGALTTSANSTIGGLLTVTGGLSVNQGGIVNGLLTTNQINATGVAVSGNVNINGNLSVGGSKNNVVRLPAGNTVLLYANESPEYWFEDFGTVQLKNGRAVVHMDRTFTEATNTSVPYKVFITPNGNTRGLYVIRKTPTSFEVRENGRGRSSVTFDYRVVAKRRGYEAHRFGRAEASK